MVQQIRSLMHEAESTKISSSLFSSDLSLLGEIKNRLVGILEENGARAQYGLNSNKVGSDKLKFMATRMSKHRTSHDSFNHATKESINRKRPSSKYVQSDLSDVDFAATRCGGAKRKRYDDKYGNRLPNTSSIQTHVKTRLLQTVNSHEKFLQRVSSGAPGKVTKPTRKSNRKSVFYGSTDYDYSDSDHLSKKKTSKDN